LFFQSFFPLAAEIRRELPAAGREQVDRPAEDLPIEVELLRVQVVRQLASEPGRRIRRQVRRQRQRAVADVAED
jgi:hypothetical protein